MNQRDVFLTSEADAYYQRNRSHLTELLAAADDDPIVAAIGRITPSPRSILEIGCSKGWRLEALRTKYDAMCWGVDPSDEAIRDGCQRFPDLKLRRGTADTLPVETTMFDLVIFGFCLYLCDRPDLFRIAAEADRVLADGGRLVVLDFHPPFPYRNGYGHRPCVFSYKMDYARMFTWNPSYTVSQQSVYGHGGGTGVLPDDRVAVTVILKDSTTAYPHEPFRSRE